MNSESDLKNDLKNKRIKKSKKEMPNYSNGKIYTIRYRNDDNLIYVGSTTQMLCRRFQKHKNQYNISLNKYITENNLLSIPEEFNMDLLVKNTCVPENYSYMECDDYNFLTMELCGDNIENVLEQYKITEQTKYNIINLDNYK